MKNVCFFLVLSFFAIQAKSQQTPYDCFSKGGISNVVQEVTTYFTNDSTSQIKYLQFDPNNFIASFYGKNDSLLKKTNLKPIGLMAISVDRLAEKYPGQSPYIYASNMPIAAIDVNGDSTYLVIYGAGYLNYQEQGGSHDLGMTFKLHATELEKQIRNSASFDPNNDDVIVVYAPSTEQFVNATNTQYASGAIKSLTVFSHGYGDGLSLGGRRPTDANSNQTIADADLNDYDRREINTNNVSQIDFTNFGSNAVVTFYGCNIGGYYSTNTQEREQNAQSSFAYVFSQTSGLETQAFTGGAENKVIGGQTQYGSMIRSVDRNSQTTNFSIFQQGQPPLVPAAQ
ncbi:MAG: hypothetical protein ACOCWG_04160 [bacterium]